MDWTLSRELSVTSNQVPSPLWGRARVGGARNDATLARRGSANLARLHAPLPRPLLTRGTEVANAAEGSVEAINRRAHELHSGMDRRVAFGSSR